MWIEYLTVRAVPYGMLPRMLTMKSSSPYGTLQFSCQLSTIVQQMHKYQWSTFEQGNTISTITQRYFFKIYVRCYHTYVLVREQNKKNTYIFVHHSCIGLSTIFYHERAIPVPEPYVNVHFAYFSFIFLYLRTGQVMYHVIILQILSLYSVRY